MNQPGTSVAFASPVVSPFNKGLGLLTDPLNPEEIQSRDWNVLKEDLSLPCAVLYEDKLRHNLNWMQRFISDYGVQLAPHGKTTMAPRLFHRQLESGAWGITLATAHQSMAAWKQGIKRVLMANQLVGKQNMSIVAHMLEDPDFDYYCLVDSAELVEQLGSFFSARGRRLNVLLEVGVVGGRTGIRNDAQLGSVLRALGRWRHSLALCGVEMYEGVLDEEAAIREFLQRAIDVTRQLINDGRFDRTPALLSGAGSAWYDVVAEEFTAARLGGGIEIVLRPGCYLTHDIGSYKKAQARILESNPIAKKMQSGLEPALHLWAYVQSIPEPTRAIITLGKRDAAFDSGLPTPALHYKPGDDAPKAAPAHWSLTKMMDQHAYMQIGAQDAVRVGDMIAFDISHPCLTFDKWRVIPIVNAEYQVVDLVQTYF